jgi:hypothetical protein
MIWIGSRLVSMQTLAASEQALRPEAAGEQAITKIR